MLPVPQSVGAAVGFVDHVRVYGFDLKERLHCVGFQVNEEYYAQEFDPND